jgi:hypothetical protein
MRERKRLSIADDYFYHKINIPGKVSYIKHVAKSCRNYDELFSVELWGYKILEAASAMFSRVICEKNCVRDYVNILQKFSENYKIWKEELADTFKQLETNFEFDGKGLIENYYTETVFLNSTGMD